MYSSWTQHLNTDEDKEKFRNEIYGAKKVLDHVVRLIDDEVEALDRSEMDQRIYDIPNWDYRQAHKNGARHAYSVIKRLVNLDQQKGN